MQHTTNYSIFKDHISNREVDPAHVRRLVQAIRTNNLLHVNPIIVDGAMHVVDGQHRLEAAKELGVKIYYLVDQTVSHEDIAFLNSNQKNWTPMDYVNYFSIQKKPGYDKLSSFLSQYPFFSVTTAARLMGDNSGHRYKEGYLDASNLEEAELVAKIAQWFYERYPEFAGSRNFINAISMCYASGQYDHEVMEAKVAMQPRSVVRCASQDQYVQMLEEIYNYRSHVKVRFR